MKRTLLLLVVSILALTFSSGCASIVGGGGSQEVTFNSSPDGAMVTIDGRAMGKTPFTLRIDRKSNQALKFEKDGYEPVEMQLATRMNPWFWGNIIFGGLLGSTTDGLTGAIHEYMPNQYLIDLTPVGTISTIGAGSDARKNSAKSYIVVNYSSITTELNSGPGEYLQGLSALLEIPEPERPAAYEKIKAMSNTTHDVVVFADEVISTYIR